MVWKTRKKEEEHGEKKVWEYKAFVSYRQNSFDRKVAIELQKRLERFHISKKISAERQWKIFRDETELPASDDLSQNIKRALEKSEFLIVICSKTIKESSWCKREIEYFKSLHDSTTNKIIAVLINGSPSESFPEALCWKKEKRIDQEGKEEIVNIEIEPLAANIIAESEKASLRKLKKEFLKIAAQMLGVTYDTLKQRQKIYHYKRMLVIVNAVSLFAITFAAYSYRQTAIISRQKKEISDEYTKNLLSQSQYYVKEAKELKQNNNSIQAAEKLLYALPDEKTQSPVLSDAIFELSDILNLYKSEYAEENEVTPVQYLKFEQNMEDAFLIDSSGKYLFISNTEKIWVYDTEDFEVINTIELPESVSIHLFQDCFLMSGNRIVYRTGSAKLYCVDYLTGEVIWSNLGAFSEGYNEISWGLSENQETLVAVTYGKVYAFDTETGKKKGKWYYAPRQDANIKEYTDPDKIQKPDIETNIAFSGDKRYFAFSTNQYEGDDLFGNTLSYVYVVDTQKNRVTALKERYHYIEQLLISESGQLFIMDSTVKNGTVNNKMVDVKGNRMIHCIDIQKKEKVWDTTAEYCGEKYLEKMQIIESPYTLHKGKILFVAYGNEIEVIACEDGTVIQNSRYRSPLIEVYCTDERIFAIHEDGTYSWNYYWEGEERPRIIYRNFFGLNSIAKKAGDFFYVMESDNPSLERPRGIVKYQYKKRDASYQCLLKQKIKNFWIDDIEDGWICDIEGNKIELIDSVAGKYYKMNFNKEGEDEGEVYSGNILGVSTDRKKIYFYYNTYEAEGKFALYQIDTEKQEVNIIQMPLQQYEQLEDVLYYNDRVYYLTTVEENIDLTDKIIIIDSSEEIEKNETNCIAQSYDKMRLYSWRCEDNISEQLVEVQLEKRDSTIIYMPEEETDKIVAKAIYEREAEEYVGDSFTISADGKQLSWGIKKDEQYIEESESNIGRTRFLTFDLENKKCQSIIPEQLETISMYSVKQHLLSKNGKIHVIVYEKPDQWLNSTVQIFDEKGQKLNFGDGDDNIEEAGKIFFSKNKDWLWLDYKEKESLKCKLVAYDIQKQEVCTTIDYEQYPLGINSNFGYGYMQWISDTAFVLYSGYSTGIIVDEQYAEYGGLIAQVPQCVGVDEETNKIYTMNFVEEGVEVGSFDYVSLEEIIEQGKKFCNMKN